MPSALGVVACLAVANPVVVAAAESPNPASSNSANISTAYAKAMARRLLGDDAVRHMVHRVEVASRISDPVTSYREYSSNWGAYVSDLNGTSYLASSVQGHFTYQPTCSGCVPHLATWVGIGGYKVTNQLIQTGIDQSNGYAWYELLPAGPVYYNLHSIGGDPMVGVVSKDYDTGLWYIDIQDLGTNYYFSGEFSYSPSQKSSEWIEENTNYTQGTPSFNTITFSSSYWTAVGSITTVRPINSSLASAVHQYFVRATNDGSCISPSGLASGGEGFTVSRTSSC
jgi:hypothetical protein